mmetsp:Transcript_30490/g.51388  ORF Transcript_30490/g.51388 Transcript_30490/m.51388 type:complete len:516 (+) Transcript_30490:56-1603(+)
MTEEDHLSVQEFTACTMDQSSTLTASTNAYASPLDTVIERFEASLRPLYDIEGIQEKAQSSLDQMEATLTELRSVTMEERPTSKDNKERWKRDQERLHWDQERGDLEIAVECAERRICKLQAEVETGAEMKRLLAHNQEMLDDATIKLNHLTVNLQKSQVAFESSQAESERMDECAQMLTQKLNAERSTTEALRKEKQVLKDEKALLEAALESKTQVLAKQEKQAEADRVHAAANRDRAASTAVLAAAQAAAAAAEDKALAVAAAVAEQQAAAQAAADAVAVQAALKAIEVEAQAAMKAAALAEVAAEQHAELEALTWHFNDEIEKHKARSEAAAVEHDHQAEAMKELEARFEQEVEDHKEDQARTVLLLEEEMGSNKSLKLKIAHLEQKIYVSHIDYSASMARLGDINKALTAANEKQLEDDDRKMGEVLEANFVKKQLLQEDLLRVEAKNAEKDQQMQQAKAYFKQLKTDKEAVDSKLRAAEAQITSMKDELKLNEERNTDLMKKLYLKNGGI